MKTEKPHFVEVCLYSVKSEKQEEFEQLIKKVLIHHSQYPGVIDVRYMKRTHRPTDFSGAKRGDPSIRLTRSQPTVTYVLYWELDNEIIHGQATKSGLQNFFKEFNRCLVKAPTMILGERID